MKDRILRVASDLFYSNGIRSVGVDRIVSTAGVAKATLYGHFASKEAIVVAYLRDRDRAVINELKRVSSADDRTVRERVLTLFGSLEDKARAPGFRGCAFMLAVAEHEDSVMVKEQALRHKDAVLEIFREMLPAGTDKRDELARKLCLLYEGALAQIMIYRDARSAALARDCAADLLNTTDL